MSHGNTIAVLFFSRHAYGSINNGQQADHPVGRAPVYDPRLSRPHSVSRSSQQPQYNGTWTD